MTLAKLKSTVVYVTEETTEGTAVDPSVGTEAVGITSDGFSMNGEKELIERNLLRAGIKRQVPRTGIKTSSISLAVEAAANGTAGAEPDYDLLLRSLLGGRRQSATVTSGTTNTTTVLNIDDADIAKFSVGDIVLVKEAGAFHISPITAVDDTVAAANITLLIPASASFSDNVAIEAFTTYFGENTGHKDLTITAFLEDLYKMQAPGNKVASMSLDGFETGQLPTLSFSLNGLGYTETASTASGLTASTSDAAPPIVLDACVYVDGALVAVNSVSLSVENTLGRVTSTCSPNGVISQLVTERAISGSFTPYLETDDSGFFNKFDKNTEFSLFLRAHNPTGVAGEKQQAWGIFIPKAVITALPKSDQDGVMRYDLEWQAGEDDTGTYSSDIYISYM